MAHYFLLHGFGGSPETWQGIVPEDVESVTPTLTGHADRGPVCGFDEEVERLRPLAAALPRPRLGVGYSLGGRLLLSLAIAHPSLFDGLVIVSSTAGIEDPAERELRAKDDGKWSALLRQGIEAFFDRWEAQPLFESQRALPAEVLARQRARRKRLDHILLAEAYDLLTPARMENFWPRLGELVPPLVYVAGALDRKYLGIGARLVELVPRARLHIVEGVGHNVPLEAPQQLRAILVSAAEGLGAEQASG